MRGARQLILQSGSLWALANNHKLQIHALPESHLGSAQAREVVFNRIEASHRSDYHRVRARCQLRSDLGAHPRIRGELSDIHPVWNDIKKVGFHPELLAVEFPQFFGNEEESVSTGVGNSSEYTPSPRLRSHGLEIAAMFAMHDGADSCKFCS